MSVRWILGLIFLTAVCKLQAQKFSRGLVLHFPGDSVKFVRPGSMDSLWQGFPGGYVRADSAVMRDTLIHIYYTIPSRPDSVVLVSSEKIPASLQKYVNRMLKQKPSPRTLYAMLREYGFSADRMNLVRLNHKEVLYVRGRYAVASSAAALLQYGTDEGTKGLYGDASLKTGGVFAGIDRLEASYSGRKDEKQFYFSYALLLPGGLPAAVKISLMQWKREKDFMTEAFAVVRHKHGPWSWGGGVRFYGDSAGGMRHWTVSAGYEPIIPHYRLRLESTLIGGKEGIVRWAVRSQWHGGKRFPLRLEVDWDRAYKPRSGSFLRYRRYDNYNLFFNPAITGFARLAMQAGWNKKKTEFYVFSRAYDVLRRQNQHIRLWVPGAGMVIFQKNGRTGIEFYKTFNFSQQFDKQPVMIAILQSFHW